MHEFQNPDIKRRSFIRQDVTFCKSIFFSPFSSHFHSIAAAGKSNIARERLYDTDEERHWHFRILVSVAGAAPAPSATLPTLSRPRHWFSAQCSIWRRRRGGGGLRAGPVCVDDKSRGGTRWQPQAHYFCHAADPCWLVCGGTVKIVSLVHDLFSKAAGCRRLNGGLTSADKIINKKQSVGERCEDRIWPLVRPPISPASGSLVWPAIREGLEFGFGWREVGPMGNWWD